jgi:hypothetical protein
MTTESEQEDSDSFSFKLKHKDVVEITRGGKKRSIKLREHQIKAFADLQKSFLSKEKRDSN